MRSTRLVQHLSLATTATALLLATSATAQTVKKEVSLSAVELRTRQDAIRAFFQERTQRKRLVVVSTTTTKSGQTIDWIRPESQVPGGKLATPPPRDVKEAPDKEIHPALQRQAATKFIERSARAEGVPRGPKGTVPVVRFQVEKFLGSSKIPPQDPRDIFRKTPPPSPDSNERYYAVWQRFGASYGTAGRINIWDTVGPVSNETSIAQTAVIRGNPMQAVEVGKIEVQSLNGDRQPYLFTYYRTSGSASGDWVGGYNALVDGWIQHSSRVAPGMSLAAWRSSTGGNQYSLDIEVRLHEGNWWVWAAGEWAGYYPYCKGGGPRPCSDGTLFAENGLRDQADRLDWYGEVFDESAPAATTTDMGSGAFAALGWQRAAYFRNITYYWAPATYWWWDSGSVGVSDAACYSAAGPSYSSAPAWRNWFFYGGPGKEASGCR